jgi:hypothetical protein
MNGSYYTDDPLKLFGEGVGSAWGLFVLELAIFFWNSMQSYLPTIPANSTETTQVLSYYSETILLFTLIAIIQSAIIGFIAKKPFLLGYLVGVGVLFYVLYVYALNVIPSVIYGLGSSVAITLGSLIIRLYLESYN